MKLLCLMLSITLFLSSSYAQLSSEIKDFVREEGKQFNLTHATKRREILSHSKVILVSNDKISIMKGEQKKDYTPEGMECFHNYKALSHNLVVPLVHLSNQGTLSDDYRVRILRNKSQIFNFNPKTKEDKIFMRYFSLGLEAQEKFIQNNDVMAYNRAIAPLEEIFIKKATDCQVNGLINLWKKTLYQELLSDRDNTYIAIVTSSQARKGNAQFQFFTDYAHIDKKQIFFITDEFENENKIKDLIAVKIFDKKLGEEHYSSSQKLERDLLEIPFQKAIKRKAL